MNRAEWRRQQRDRGEPSGDRYPWLKWVLVGVLVLALIGLGLIATGNVEECPPATPRHVGDTCTPSIP